MKKLIFILVLVIKGVSFTANSQTTGAAVTTVPANFTAVDQVKIIVDVSAVGNLANKEPLYIWTWHPSDPAPGNGEWSNSNEDRKMTKEGPNKWSWTMKPSDYYAKMVNGVLTPLTPAELTEIRFLVKAKDGTGDIKSSDIILKVAPLVFTPTAFRTFPSVAGQDEILKVYLDQKLVKNDLNAERMNPVTADIFLYSTTNALIGIVENKPLQSMGDKVFSFAIFPRGEFQIPAGTVVNKMIVFFKGTLLDTNGQTVAVNSEPYEKLFDDLK